MQNLSKHSSSTVVDTSGTVIHPSAIYDLLPVGSTLELNEEVRIASLLSTQSPRILALQQFTKNEWVLLITLLKYYPYYVPHEELLASLTSLSPITCRQKLHEAQEIGAEAVKRELKPVYRALCGIRAKLTKLCPCLKVSLVRDAGYILTFVP